jgi:hypothetical protein
VATVGASLHALPSISVKTPTVRATSVSCFGNKTVETMTQTIRGVLAPVVTPFKADLAPDSQRFIAQIRFRYFLAVH